VSDSNTFAVLLFLLGMAVGIFLIDTLGEVYSVKYTCEKSK